MPSTRVNVAIPDDVHKRARLAAQIRGISMKDAIVEAVTVWIGDENKLVAQAQKLMKPRPAKPVKAAA